MGVPFNEINTKLKLGLEDTDAGDVGYIPAGILPIDFANDPTIQADPNAMKSLSPEILSKLGYGE
jgi:hypothetical protein